MKPKDRAILLWIKLLTGVYATGITISHTYIFKDDKPLTKIKPFFRNDEYRFTNSTINNQNSWNYYTFNVLLKQLDWLFNCESLIVYDIVYAPINDNNENKFDNNLSINTVYAFQRHL